MHSSFCYFVFSCNKFQLSTYPLYSKLCTSVLCSVHFSVNKEVIYPLISATYTLSLRIDILAQQKGKTNTIRITTIDIDQFNGLLYEDKA